MQCIFCRIARKEIPAEIVYEDEHSVAFLDIQPRSPGHTLVIPRAHISTFLELSDAELAHLMGAVRRMAQLLEERIGAEGLTIGINHREASGQEVAHLHMHLMPRFSGDSGGPIQIVVSNPPRESLEEIARKLRA